MSTAPCAEVRERLSDWIDQALAPADRERLEAHLAGCPACREEADRLQRTVLLLRQAPPVRAPAGFVDRVLARARPEPWPRRLARRLRDAWGPGRSWPSRLPLPLAAMVLVGLGAVWLHERTPEVAMQAARDVAPPASRLEAPPAAAPSAPAGVEARQAPGVPAAPSERSQRAQEERALAGSGAPKKRENKAPPAQPAPRARGPAEQERAAAPLSSFGAPLASEARPPGPGAGSGPGGSTPPDARLPAGARSDEPVADPVPGLTTGSFCRSGLDADGQPAGSGGPFGAPVGAVARAGRRTLRSRPRLQPSRLRDHARARWRPRRTNPRRRRLRRLPRPSPSWPRPRPSPGARGRRPAATPGRPPGRRPSPRGSGRRRAPRRLRLGGAKGVGRGEGAPASPGWRPRHPWRGRSPPPTGRPRPGPSRLCSSSWEAGPPGCQPVSGARAFSWTSRSPRAATASSPPAWPGSDPGVPRARPRRP